MDHRIAQGSARRAVDVADPLSAVSLCPAKPTKYVTPRREPGRRLGRRALVVMLCVAHGCSATPAPARPTPLAGRIVRYQPLELQRDARQPGQAVILGTDDRNGSTVLALPVAATVVVVHAMPASRAGGGPSTAAPQAIVLTSAPAPTGAAIGAATAPPSSPVQVGVADEAAPAARWRAGVWAAALAAAAALGKDPSDLALEATPAGPVDGTASALVAAGFVAALIGDTLDPGATLTGAIEPDGAIGPVAGLPEQVAAALAHGKKRIGYPSGMRVARTTATGKDVDLVQLATAHGAQAIELADLHDAYQLLTGHQLPATVPVAAAAMALDPATLERLEARYTAWQRRLGEEWAPLLQLEQAGRMPAAVAAMVRAAHGRGERAEAMHRAGRLAAAHREMRAAWLEAAAANQTHAVIARLAGGDLDGALAALTALDPGDAGVRGVFARIAEAPAAPIAGHVAALDAVEAALRGWADHELAADSLRRAAQLIGELRGKPAAELGGPATAEAVAGVIAPTVLGFLRAATEVSVAGEALEPAPGPGVACACPPASLRGSAAALEAAAGAALGHVDALLVEPLARKLGTPIDAARARTRALEPDYAIADLPRSAAAGLPRELAAAWGEDAPATGLVALAGARAAYHGAAVMIAKYDTLGVHGERAAPVGATGAVTDAAPAGAIGAVHHPLALRRLLAVAERAARAAAHAAEVATGAIPVQARLAYQLAAIDAAGGPGDQLDALAELWTATAVSNTAVMLARSCAPAVPR